MDDANPSEVTRFLAALGSDDRRRTEATPRVFELLYQELRNLAAAALSGERTDHTLQPTALVHEAYMRLVKQNEIVWKDRHHVLYIAGRAMRRVLVDYARRRAAERRGDNPRRVTLSGVAGFECREIALFELDEALTKLASKSERAARVAELKVFVGLGREEIASALGVSARTVTDDWTMARMWLARELAA